LLLIRGTIVLNPAAQLAGRDIPAKAGIQGQGKKELDSRLRGNERNML
jgi:hypothetical protein